jgi:hypothetical protein
MKNTISGMKSAGACKYVPHVDHHVAYRFLPLVLGKGTGKPTSSTQLVPDSGNNNVLLGRLVSNKNGLCIGDQTVGENSTNNAAFSRKNNH